MEHLINEYVEGKLGYHRLTVNSFEKDDNGVNVFSFNENYNGQATVIPEKLLKGLFIPNAELLDFACEIIESLENKIENMYDRIQSI